MKKKIIYLLLCALMILICLKPEMSKEYAAKGIEISLNIIVPSLFPFMFLTALLSKTVNKISIPTVFIISALGGYPVGAKLIEENYTAKRISLKTANYMQCFCVNAGPAFVISAVGCSVLGSKKIGALLLTCHLLSSLFIMCFFMIFIKDKPCGNKKSEFSFSAASTEALKSASYSTVTVCGYIIIFSLITGFLRDLKYAVLLLEISNSVTLTDNIYLLSFLLGFGGFCVWLQIISISKNSKINLKLFALSRLSHGLLSALLTYISVKLFNININTVSTLEATPQKDFKNGIFIFLSMAIMLAVLILQINDKKFSGNFKKDIV